MTIQLLHNSFSRRTTLAGLVSGLGFALTAQVTAALSPGGHSIRASAQNAPPEISLAKETLMYTIVERRTVNLSTIEETIQRGQSEFFPLLLAAPGFSGFYLVADEPNATNTATIVWESKAQAEAFDAENSVWMEKLEALGHPLQSLNRGETVVTVEPAA